MIKFLLKITGYSTIVFAIGILFWIKSGNTIYASPYLQEKINFLQKNKKFNTVFIGSSKINNQINPQKIDSINTNIKSYNLGANASFNLENYQTIDYLLEQNNLHLKLIVLELQNKINVTRTNLNTERSFASFTPNNLLFSLHYHWENHQIKQVFFNLYSTAINILHYNKKNKIAEDNYLKKYIQKDGFVPLDKDTNIGVIQRNKALLKDTMEINRRLQAFEKNKNIYPENLVLVEKLKEINAKCKAKGIQFVLLISAPAEPDAKELLAYKNIKNIPLINMMMPKENPEFYKIQNRWDYGHLNEKGADILSIKIGNKLKNILD